MIQAFGLTSNPRKAHPPAVDDVTFEAGAGRVTALLGEAGAGKTTTLRLMLELQQGRGLTYFRGRPLHRIAHPSREVGVLLGDVPGHPSRSVRGHLRMLCAAAGVPARRADEVLEAVGLVSLREERLGTLSHGVDRRLGLACALLADPHTLVLDEPANGLPTREAHWLHRMLRAHAAQGGTVLFTTADPKEAARDADRVVTLEAGRVVADQEAGEFARTRLRPRVAVRSPHAARLAAALSKEARAAHRSVEVVREDGNRLSVYGSSTAEVGETAFRHGILVHQLADETGDMGPGAGGGPSTEEAWGTGTVPEAVRQEPDHGEPDTAEERWPGRERRCAESAGEQAAVDGARQAYPQRFEEVSAAGRPDAPPADRRGDADVLADRCGDADVLADRRGDADTLADRRREADTLAVAPQPRAELGGPQPAAAPGLAQQSRTTDQEPGRSRTTAVTEPGDTAGPQPHPTGAGRTDHPAVTSAPASPDTERSPRMRPPAEWPAPAAAQSSTAPAPARPSAPLGSAEPAGHAGSTRTAPAVPAQPPAATSGQSSSRPLSVQAPAAQQSAHAASATAQPVPSAVSADAPEAQPSADAVSVEAVGGESAIRAASTDAPAAWPSTHSEAAETTAAEVPAVQAQPEPELRKAARTAGAKPAPAPVRPARRDGAAGEPDPLSPLPPPISVRLAPSPLRPLRYELRRAAGIGTGFLTCGAVLLVSALTALLLARVGHTPQARLFAAWPRELPLPPAALGAGLLGALAFGDEFRHPALASDRGTVPRRLGLLTAKLLVSGATAVLLSFLTLGCDAEVLYLVYGRELARVPTDWISLTASWFALIVGCAWAGVLAAGVFRSTTAGLAAVLAVPVLVVPVVHRAVQGAGVRMAAGLPMRMREMFLLKWPFGGERYLVGAVRVVAQPVGGALALSLVALVGAYLFSTLRTRAR
ncbi:MAG: ATP-binding cassette domain-containing protein [Streptomyces sp.]|uniref:ATP-binding cassette domain-containing protein n=1 Tax=Streptomyces sp. TaxID=1931 RepID=UPI0025DB7805|nr:ATP-binding cassette domain-containing protein [Streptomyces sp.]MBW8792942.1 ATP-binding cassette domain-containing protein [Streptomyces sp.]